MRIARTLLLAALAALAAMALTATTATANPVHVESENEEGPGNPVCSDAADNCDIHIVGIGPESGGPETQLILQPFGVVSLCEDEFEGEIFNEAGDGVLDFQEIHQGPSNNCNVSECTTAGEDTWEFSMEEVAGEVEVPIRFCVFSGTLQQELHCDLDPHIVDIGTHYYEIHANNLPCENNPDLAVNGAWEIETHPQTVPGHDDIEIVHPPA